MKIEYEATFTNIDKDEIRNKLKNAGAELIRPEFFFFFFSFSLPEGHDIEGGFVRVRDEGDKITVSLKVIDGNKIENQKEICLAVDNFDEAVEFVKSLGCRQKAYQETKRELWYLDNTEITIDEWPFLEPLIEIEGRSEEVVKSVSEKLGFDYAKAMFCAATTIYSQKYGISEDVINNHTPLIIFEMKNPFVK